MTSKLRGISLIAFTAAAVAVAAPSANAVSFLLEAETAPGVFTSFGELGALPAFVGTVGGTPVVGTLDEFYASSTQFVSQGSGFGGPRVFAANGATTIGVVEAIDGTGLVTVNGLGLRGGNEGLGGAINISYTFSDAATFGVLDGSPAAANANDFYFVDGNPQNSANQNLGTDFNAQQGWAPGSTDGTVIGRFDDVEAIGLQILISLEDEFGQDQIDQNPDLDTVDNPANVFSLRFLGDIAQSTVDGTGPYDVDTIVSFDLTDPDAPRNFRLTVVPAQVPVPASLALFGLGLAAAGFAVRRAR